MKLESSAGWQGSISHVIMSLPVENKSLPLTLTAACNWSSIGILVNQIRREALITASNAAIVLNLCGAS